MTTAERYAEARRKWPYLPARHALAEARRVDNALEWEWDANGQTATCQHEHGFTLTLKIELDDMPPDGTFTDTYTPGLSVKLNRAEETPRGDWIYYDGVSGTLAEHRAGYSAMGYARHRADCEARAILLADAKAALEGQRYAVIVIASAAGVELGYASIWGVDCDSYGEDARRLFEDVAADHCLIEEAVTMARETLNELAKRVTA